MMKKTSDTYPLVAVRMLTYNQEHYISQSINSVLSQKTDFNFLLIIGEDCSTDRTGEICREYAEKYPDQIKLIRNSSNNIKINSLNNFKACKESNAKYIALIEGDDYWCDDYKLQKQITFLENNAEYSISCHRVYELSKNVMKHSNSVLSNTEETYTIRDLAKSNFISTVSMVCRAAPIYNIPEDFFDLPALDYVFNMWLAKEGKIKYFPELMAVYRIGSGVWSTLSRDRNYFKLIKVLDKLIAEFGNSAEVRDELIIQKLKLAGAIEDFDIRSSLIFSTEDIQALLEIHNQFKEYHLKVLSEPKLIALNIPLGSMIKAIGKKITGKLNYKINE